jgi:hypothetical protein
MSVRISGLVFGVALALTVTAAPAAEDMQNANFIMRGCRGFIDRTPGGPARLMEWGQCAGIVNGIAYVGFMINLAGLVSPPGMRLPPVSPDATILDPNSPATSLAFLRHQLCLDIPDGVTTGQEVRVVIAYIDARPARMHEDFRSLALEALRAAWPCK